MPTNVPPPTFGDTGFSAPAESAVRAGVFADINAAFGGNVNPDESTPQGQLADALSAQIGENNDAFLFYANMVDPAYASGRMQDGIARIYFLARKGPLPTTVIATVTGKTGTIIPAGSLARSSDGTVFETLSQVTIPAGGSTTVEFASVADGPIPCPAGSLTTIYRAVSGWDSVINPADGILGRDTETRADFEARRSASVAGNSLGMLQSLRAEVLGVDGILDVYVTENPLDTSATVGGVTLPKHSLYVAAVGGSDADVARAIWSKKPPGCDYYGGNTSVTVIDTDGYASPYPSYTVTFERPDALPIYFAITLADGPGVPSDAVAQVRAAIVAAFAGEDGGPRARIGATLFAGRFYAPIYALGAWAQIVSIKVGTSASPTTDEQTVDIDQVPTIASSRIAVALA